MTMTQDRPAAGMATTAARPAAPNTPRPAVSTAGTPGGGREAPARAARPRRNGAYDRVLHLSELMTRRPDLHGVYKPADVAAEAVRWSA